MSTILHGRFLMTTKPFFRSAEHCIGKVSEESALADSIAKSFCQMAESVPRLHLRSDARISSSAT